MLFTLQTKNMNLNVHVFIHLEYVNSHFLPFGITFIKNFQYRKLIIEVMYNLKYII